MLLHLLLTIIHDNLVTEIPLCLQKGKLLNRVKIKLVNTCKPNDDLLHLKQEGLFITTLLVSEPLDGKHKIM